MDGAHPKPRVCWCVWAIHVAGTIKNGPAWIQYSACRRTLLGFTGGHGTLPGWYPDGTLYSWLLNGSSSHGNFITWLPISHWNKKRDDSPLAIHDQWPQTCMWLTSRVHMACIWFEEGNMRASGEQTETIYEKTCDDPYIVTILQVANHFFIHILRQFFWAQRWRPPYHWWNQKRVYSPFKSMPQISILGKLDDISVISAFERKHMFFF